MKSGNYEDLINKFYAGTASAEEVLLLKSKRLIDEQDELYAQAIEEEKGLEMNWGFDDFMKEIPEARVVALPVKRNWIKVITAAAAVVLAIASVYILLPQPIQKQSAELAIVTAVNINVDSNKSLIAKAALPNDELKDDLPLVKKTADLSTDNKSLNVKVKKKSVRKKIFSPANKEKVEVKNKFNEYLVMVNGKPIYNEEEAMAITQKSLSMVSRNLTTTMDEMKPITQIKMKLK